ncbi:MAG TPA: tRNA preQ1(34) S-adenosylmethionine ribosyltransferase-isomerase QueA [Candidatus Acidoferrum sp.]|nr:tRNA preQ1(34) S-adenosylmethionine ribosyltransferase-isomerase QueA [Candidatus Acidoferrum sp.]
MRTSEFDFELPEELIAQDPAPSRDASRLMALHRSENRIEHGGFRDLLSYLRAGDVLVLNNSKVIPARLRAVNAATGGAFEVLLLEEKSTNDWWVMMRPAKRARVGTELTLLNLRGERTEISATVIDTNPEGHRRLRFHQRALGILPSSDFNISDALLDLGQLPLPPYIKREQLTSDDHTRYQTIYAHEHGSVAAPTAGLHFTKQLLEDIQARGVHVFQVTLHVGLGTFAPVKAERVEEHTMHHERFHVPADVAEMVNAAKREQRRVIAVGTTSVRVLESVAREHDGEIIPGTGRTNIFIYPPYCFRVVDALITNFHLPRSTLLMLVSAFASPRETSGRELILNAYRQAIRDRYRFFSYGDAMLIL